MKKILIATGGTGGHIYPAIVTAEFLRSRGWDVTFVGAFGAAEDKLKVRGFRCVSIRAKGVVSKGLKETLIALACSVGAFGDCVSAVTYLKPDVVLGFGGYSSFPAVMAAVVLRVPSVIHEQNAVPGLANKVLSRFVRRIAVSFKDSLAHFPTAKAVWVGCPMRTLAPSADRLSLLKNFGLEEGRTTILVFGGSQGSRAINAAFLGVLTGLPSGTNWQVIHIAGKGASEELLQGYGRLSLPYCVRDYMDNIADAYAVADIVVARSGAGTVTELGLLGLPSVLIPYPHAKNHQIENARVLERQKTSVIIEEKSLKADTLRDKLFLKLEENVSRKENQEKLRNDFAPDAVERLAVEIDRLADD